MIVPYFQDFILLLKHKMHGDLPDFFRHENQACPPSLSQYGNLRLGTKADLLKCIESCSEVKNIAPKPDTDVTIFDGAVLVNNLKPIAIKTFDHYSIKVFLPHINSHLQNICRVDIVWGQYNATSLKSQAKEKRGKGLRKRVDESTFLPQN